MNQIITNRRILWALCAALTLLPAVVLGGIYAPVLDDYIMYRGYYLYDTSYLLNTVRVWTVRPVANLLDVFVWSRFYDHLFVLFLIFAFFRITAVYLLCRFFEKQGWEGAKMPLCLCLLWCPVGIEATGWLAAATRIVTGLLFMSLSLHFLTRNRWGWFSFFLLLSFGCYEQIALAGFCLAGYDLWFRNRKMLWISLSAGVVMGSYYLICNQWNTTPRMGFQIDWSVFSRIGEGWYLGLCRLVPESFRRGLSLLEQNPWLAAALVLLSAALVLVWKPEKSTRPFSWAVGAILFTVCYLPFAVLEENSLSFRALYLSMIGIALLFQGGRGLWRKLVWGLLIIAFCVGSAGELKDYQTAGLTDARILNELAQNPERDQIMVEPHLYYHAPSVLYGQHILSVTHSDWSLTGGLRAVTKDTSLEARIKR